MQEELVLAVPASGLFPAGAFQGLTTALAPCLDFIFNPRHSRFLPRAAAETDPAWKQIIPYVVLHCGNQLFVYRRGMRSTETRLRALHSIGLGGHIRLSDDSLFATPGWPAYQAALRRELEEEVALAAPILRQRLVALINDDSTPVGQVHLGLVHLFELAAPAVRARESKIAAAHFAPLAELTGPAAPAFETWSSFILAGWEKLLAQPPWQPAPSADEHHFHPQP